MCDMINPVAYALCPVQCRISHLPCQLSNKLGKEDPGLRIEVQRLSSVIERLVLSQAKWHIELVHVLGKVLKRDSGLAMLD